MNEITPAKPIPPDHRTAARGMLPTEQTKLSTAMIGPTRAFSTSLIRARARAVMKRALKKLLPKLSDEPGQQEPERDLLAEHRPVVAEVVGDVRPRGRLT